jgi:zinc finger SWIM domain-containing protein 3
LKEDKVGSLLNYFHNQISVNPSFFFRVQMDIEDQITNLLWDEAKMILDHSLFGDVVFFDATYKMINKEYRPFGSSFGLNHHYQQAILGLLCYMMKLVTHLHGYSKLFLSVCLVKSQIKFLVDKIQQWQKQYLW